MITSHRRSEEVVTYYYLCYFCISIRLFLYLYDTIDRHGMRQMLRVYGVRGKLLKAVQSFYVDSRACVRVGNDVRKWFPVNVGLRQGCVMSPWLFNVYMDSVV